MKALCTILLCIFAVAAFGQTLTPAVWSTAGTEDAYTVVQPPSLYADRAILNSTPTSTFSVTFGSGFPDSLKPPIYRAAAIWSYLLISTNPVRISALWSQLPSAVLSETNPDSLFRGFAGSIANHYYPVALAEAITSSELNGAARPDIIMTVNSAKAWRADTNAAPRSGKYDLATVALHEIAHGLGFYDSFDYDTTNSNGSWGILSGGIRYPTIYDSACVVGRYYQNGTRLTRSFTNPSPILGNELRSNNIYFDGGYYSYHLNNDIVPKLYAPTTFKPGSSIAHLDSATFPVGTSNSLMKHIFKPAEVIHSPGEVGLSILKDMGWNVNRLTTVIKPAAGVALRQGTIDTIKWTDNLGGQFTIDLLKKGAAGTFEPVPGSTIVNRTGAAGADQQVWNIDPALQDGEYKLRMWFPGTGTGFGLSSAFFILQQVATPIIAPPSGTYSDRVTVTMTCATPLARIYYTLNGNTPDSTSFLYNDSFDKTATTTVKAKAYKTGMPASGVASVDYTIIQSGVPIPTFSVPSGTYVGQVRFEIMGLYNSEHSITIQTGNQRDVQRLVLESRLQPSGKSLLLRRRAVAANDQWSYIILP